jgi:hypothetical protein
LVTVIEKVTNSREIYNNSAYIHRHMTEIPRARVDTVKEAIVGFEKTSDVGEDVSEEDAEDARDVSEGNAKRQKRFLADIGVLDKEGYDYFLTEDGQALGEYIRFNQEEQASETLRELFKEHWEALDELLANVDEDGMQREDLVDKVAFITATELTSNRREYGAETIVDLLEWTGFLKSDEDDDVYYPVDDGENERDESSGKDSTSMDSKSDTVTESVEETESESDKEVESESESGMSTASMANGGVEASTEDTESSDGGLGAEDSMEVNLQGRLNLSIDLELSGEENPENVRKLILAIRKAANQDVDEYEFPEQIE